ncbi:MAG TPA: dicarboxylate/amino acid:cation symporter [Gammaproteobacteria bacterium]|jgi:Na+/H+-dicarboxylate symporter|nr:dicarboxylate/amino acid:cation symporter [Gammaproteobacteria bacterium]
MCGENKKKLKFTQPFILYFIMLTLGILVGLSNISYLQSFGLMISDIFIKIFKFISMPIIALSIIVTLSSYENNDVGMSRIWRRTLLYTFSTTMIAALLSCILYIVIHPSNVNVSTENIVNVANKTTYWQHLSSLIPNNIFSPFIEHQVLSVLILGILIGIAIRYIPDNDAKIAVKNVFKGFHGIFFIITQWVIMILPLGVFGFMTTTVLQLRDGMNIHGIVQYLLVIIAANLIQGFIILPAWLYYNQIKPFDTMKKMMPALTLAFFSKSSAGTLPVTINTAEEKLKLSPKISRFVLPLCTSLNMNGCAAFIFATVIFLMQNHGIEITLFTMLTWVVIGTIAAIGNAGVPMGCFFLSASLLTTMDIPIVLMGVILPFYTIIDMLETALNVWSDSCVAKVVAKDDLVPMPQPVLNEG